MNEKEEKVTFSHPMGYSLMLAIMVILALVIFAVLSLSTSVRDYNYSRKAADNLSAYCAANSAAYQRLEEIDKALSDSGTLDEALRNIEVLSGMTVVAEQDAFLVSYEVDVEEYQKLFVELEISADELQRPEYEIQQWKKNVTADWENQTTLPVMGAE